MSKDGDGDGFDDFFSFIMFWNIHFSPSDRSDILIPRAYDDWVNHRYIDIPEDSFRLMTGVQSIVDAKDFEGNWYEAVVLDIYLDSYSVHYIGWNLEWNRIILKSDVKPLYSHVKPWRRELKEGSDLDVKFDEKYWYQGIVVKKKENKVLIVPSINSWYNIDLQTQLNDLEITNKIYSSKIAMRWYTLNSDYLSEFKVHTHRKYNATQSTHILFILRSLCLQGRANWIPNGLPIMNWLCKLAPYWVILNVVPYLTESKYYRRRPTNSEINNLKRLSNEYLFYQIIA